MVRSLKWTGSWSPGGSIVSSHCLSFENFVLQIDRKLKEELLLQAPW